jgi:hypothetical protein
MRHRRRRASPHRHLACHRRRVRHRHRVHREPTGHRRSVRQLISTQLKLGYISSSWHLRVHVGWVRSAALRALHWAA